MIESKKRIGFDRYVKLEWCKAAIEVALQRQSIEDLNGLVGQTLLGMESRRKTVDILNRLWINPFPELKDFSRRSIELYAVLGDSALLPLCWGVAIATYPFFGKTSEITGRLFNLNEDCSIAEVQRRMAEVYGERDGINRAASRVLQSQADWGAVARTENGKRLNRLQSNVLTNEKVVVWFVEAILRYTEKPVDVAVLPSIAVAYPFALNITLAYTLSNSAKLDVRSAGIGSQMVSIKN